MAALRWLNNNPKAFKLPVDNSKDAVPGNRQRPIVEFAIENKMVVRRRNAKNEVSKSEAKNGKKRKSSDDYDDKHAKKSKSEGNEKKMDLEDKSDKKRKAGKMHQKDRKKLKKQEQMLGAADSNKMVSKPVKEKSSSAKQGKKRVSETKKSSPKDRKQNRKAAPLKAKLGKPGIKIPKVSLSDIQKWTTE